MDALVGRASYHSRGSRSHRGSEGSTLDTAKRTRSPIVTPDEPREPFACLESRAERQDAGSAFALELKVS